MRVAFVTNFYVPELGMNTYYLACGLSKLGVDLTLFASDKYGQKKPPVPWKEGEYYKPFNLVKVRTRVVVANVPLMQGVKTGMEKCADFDVVMTEDAYQLYSRTAMIYAKARKLPLVLRHDLYESPQKFPYNVAFRVIESLVSKKICSSAKSAIVPTAAARSYLLALNPKLDVNLIPFGIDTDQFNPMYDTDVEQMKSELAQGSFKILCVSRLVESKGLFDLFQIFTQFIKIVPKARLFLIGRGNLEQALRENANQLGISSMVTFIEYCPHDRIHLFYKMCDVFLLPSYEEAPGLSVPEAMACGKPVIASDIPGVRDYVKNGEDGILVHPKDIPGFVNALLAVQSAPDTASSLGSKGAKSIEDKYSWSKVSQDTLRVLLDSLN
jgi:glycosyltransferase involved in cell wall biosynthesis